MNENRFNAYYATTPNFRIENPNPTWKSKRGWVWNKPDCVIRALANSVGISWLDAFDYLTRKARADFNVYNDGAALRKWIVEDGAKWVHCKAEKGKRRMTCLDFAKAHKSGRYIISIANHEVACVDGVLLDAWNPSDKCVVGYYDMSDFRI